MAKPKILDFPVEQLESARQLMGDLAPFFGPMVGTAILSQLWREGDVTIREAAIADMCQCYSFMKERGISTDKLDDLFDKFFPDVHTVRIPVFYIETVIQAFIEFLHNPNVTLGQAFGLERMGQGYHNRLEAMNLIFRDLKICDRLLKIKHTHESAGVPVSWESAFGQLSDELSQAGKPIGVGTIKRAYEAYFDRWVATGVSLADQVHDLAKSRPG